ncbi:MAG: protein kinase [Pirellulales bacterium]
MNDTQTLIAPPQAGESLALVVEELARRFEEGEAVDAAAFIARYPQHETALAQLLPAMAALAQFGNSNGAALALDPLAGVTDEAGRLGDFRIIREIGRGGMGVVYEAEQISLSRRVALKVLPFAGVLDERHLKRFKLEAAAAAALKHPNIVSVYCVGCERGVHFYAMEYVEGQTLAAVVDGLKCGVRNAECGVTGDSRNGDLAGTPNSELRTPHSIDTVAAALSTLHSEKPGDFFRRIAELGIQAAEALHHAHEMGIIHRDIKPANLLLDLEGKLYITDFGLARLSTDAGLTLTGDMLGTLRYMSPEQASGAKLLDERTDIYSLGVTLYELLALRPAFAENDRQKLLRQVAEQEPQRLRAINPRIPADLETIILKAMAKEPDERYAAARQLATDLAQFVADKPIAARRPSLAVRVHRWGRRHVAAVMSLVIVLALLLTVLGVALALISLEQARTAGALAKRDSAVRQAHANLGVAAEAVDKLYTNFAVAWVASETAPTSVQQDFLRQAAEFYWRIVETPAETPQDRFMQATAYERIGELEKYLENYEEALDALEESLEIGRQLHKEFPADGIYREALTVALYNLGAVLHRLNELDKADNAYREAIELLPSLPDNKSNTDRHIACLMDYANLNRQRGDFDQATRLVKEAQQQVANLRKQMPDADDWRMHDIFRKFTAADILLDQGRVEEAHKENQGALNQCQYLRTHTFHDYRPLLQNEASLKVQAARIADKRGQLPEAITHYRGALDLMRQSFKAKRTPEGVVVASISRKVNYDGNFEPGPFCSYVETQLQLADVLRRAGRPHDAEVEAGAAVLVANVLRAERPEVLRYRVACANAWAVAAHLLSTVRADESKPAYRVAARHWFEALQKFPGADRYQSGIHGRLADLQFFRGIFPDDLAKNAATDEEMDVSLGDTVFAHHARATSWFRGQGWGDSLHFATESAKLRKKDRAYDWLYVAMNHAHLGKPGVAQKWYDMSAKETEAAGDAPAELIELLETTRRLIEEKRIAAGPLALKIADVSTPESATAVLNVALSDASATPVTVDYSTAEGSAQAGVDYEPASGTLTFAAGEITRSISVPTFNDTDFEEDETFVVKLANTSAGVTIGDADATATILRSDMPQVGLVSHWTADNIAADAKGTNHATLIDGATYATGQIGQALTFDGVDDRVQVPDSPSLAFTESMTIEGWIRIASLPSTRNGGLILFRGDDRGGLDPYALSVKPGGTLSFSIHSGTNEAVAIESAIPVGRFVHVAATLDDATGVMRFYLDGALVSEKVTAIRPFGKLDPASNPGIGIGNHGGYPATIHNFPFHGLIDELKVYDKALSAEQVANHFQAGKSGRRSRVAINDEVTIESGIAAKLVNE